jgi:hypothetical protein
MNLTRGFLIRRRFIKLIRRMEKASSQIGRSMDDFESRLV